MDIVKLLFSSSMARRRKDCCHGQWKYQKPHQRKCVTWSISLAIKVLLSSAILIQYMFADRPPRDVAMGERDETGARYPENRTGAFRVTAVGISVSQKPANWHLSIPCFSSLELSAYSL